MGIVGDAQDEIYGYVRQLDNYSNPDGCNVHFTFFTSHTYSVRRGGASRSIRLAEPWWTRAGLP